MGIFTKHLSQKGYSIQRWGDDEQPTFNMHEWKAQCPMNMTTLTTFFSTNPMCSWAEIYVMNMLIFKEAGYNLH